MREAGGAGGVRDFLICGHGNGGDGDDNARNGNHLWRVMEDVSDICFLEACGGRFDSLQFERRGPWSSFARRCSHQSVLCRYLLYLVASTVWGTRHTDNPAHVLEEYSKTDPKSAKEL